MVFELIGIVFLVDVGVEGELRGDVLSFSIRYEISCCEFVYVGVDEWVFGCVCFLCF